jgi:hypothetical protein
MKKFFTPFILAISFCMILPLNAQNLITGWDGNGVTGTSSKPNDVGWLNTVTASVPWNTADNTGGCRFRDLGVTNGYTATQYAMEAGGYLSTRFLMLRYDASAYGTSVYAYPVTLDANTTYSFSLDFVCGGSATAPKNLTVGASTTASSDGSLGTSTLATTSSTTTFRNGKYTFTTGATAGTYYITFSGDWAWFGIANLNLVLSPYQLVELNKQFTNLSLGDITAVTDNLTLPRTLGTNGVTVRWASSKPSVIDTLGNVTRPSDYDATVKLTATLTQKIDTATFTMQKVFSVVVKSFNPTSEQLAEWDFAGNLISENNGSFIVKDKQSGFVGTIMNDARIRTIGTSQQFNVLDLGNGTGYFDMGTEIGKAIYSLNDYTMCGYFRIDSDYPDINSNGNFYWTFSNTTDAATDQNGYIIGSLKAESQSVSTNYWNKGNQAVGANANAALGGWHHFAYSQSGTTGTVCIDGTQVATGSVTNIPSTSITIEGRTGTLYNWLGRSNYVGDVYLRKTLLYDFQLLTISLNPSEINLFFDVASTLDKLNVAYGENPDYILPELTTEMDKLTLGDLSAVTSNISLPKSVSDTTISLSWKSTNDKVIDANGIVTRPNYYNYPDTLTATLSKNGQKVTKRFPAVVLVKEGTQFTNNLLVKYDFATVSDSVVTDAAEKHFTGKLKNDASIRSIGNTVKYNVLSLGDSIGYFDMGPEVGKLMYNLTDYTMSAYYRIDTTYTDAELAKGGNFLWNFSNGTAAATSQDGYIIGALNNQSVSITPKYYTAASGNQSVSYATAALKGGWHNLTYTQNGTLGTIYIDALPWTTGTITNLPSTALPKSGNLGTPYNWLGRSCFAGDVYLRKTLVYDFRLYNTALNDEQVQTSVLNVGSTIDALNSAYSETPSAVRNVLNSQFKVVSTAGGIKILGLTGAEKISLYDVAGRQLKVNNPSAIALNSGVYIVRINSYITKVIVN